MSSSENHAYAYANRVLTLAVAAMVAERTPHEGLLLADRDHIQWLDIEHDMPPRVGLQLRQWRAKLVDDHAPQDDRASRLCRLRELAPAQARQHAAALIEIASEMRGSVSEQPE